MIAPIHTTTATIITGMLTQHKAAQGQHLIQDLSATKCMNCIGPIDSGVDLAAFGPKTPQLKSYLHQHLMDKQKQNYHGLHK